MKKEKLLGLLVITALFLGLASVVQAQDKTYVWDRLDVDITVLDNSDIRIVETQQFTYTSGEFHYGYREITERDPEAKIIILTMYLEDEYVSEAIKAGVRGYILKDAGLEKMLEAIRAVHRGEVRIDSDMASKALMRLCQEAENPQERIISLTKREKEILSLVIKGATNKEIAEGLLVSEQTVRNRLSGIFRKLGVRNRTEAAVYAVRDGLFIPI